ncbi:hypothetical protein BMS3Abin13_02227 [bacterium BMS3Abin13]|nr:hypothetical protein BMS3Abin13_02227 [bacterium BMS3Abin13]
MYGQVHLGKTNGGSVFLQTTKGQLFRGTVTVLLNDPRALDKHAARAAGRIQNSTTHRIKHMGDQGNKGDWGEELAAVMGLLVGKLGKEIFVDAAEYITGYLF